MDNDNMGSFFEMQCRWVTIHSYIISWHSTKHPEQLSLAILPWQNVYWRMVMVMTTASKEMASSA